MGQVSRLERTARGLLTHYLPHEPMAYNIRPTRKPGAKAYQIAQAKKYGLELDGLELDIYLPNHRIAFEIQGEQHYRKVDFFTGGDDTKHYGQIERDARKRELCDRQGVTIISFDKNSLVQGRFEPWIKEFLRQQGKLPQFEHTTPPTMLYAIAESLRQGGKVKNATPYRKPGLWPLLQRTWTRMRAAC